MDEIQASLIAEGFAQDLSVEQEAELERRWQDHLAHPEDAIPWETVKANLTQKFGFKL